MHQSDYLNIIAKYARWHENGHMTTNVLDLRAGIATSDSRWSIETDDLIVFVDNTEFQKITAFNGYILVFAGHSGLMQLWKDWCESGFQSDRPPDEVDGVTVAVSITDTVTSEVLFERLQKTPAEDARFAGSGAVHAMRCWMSNFCAKRAVSSAMLVDIFSGGAVRYYNFDGDNNVVPDGRVEVILSDMANRGMIMYKKSTERAVPIGEAAANDPLARDILEKISSGAVSACAPCEEMFMPWTNEEKHRLDRAISRVIRPR